MRVTPTHSFLRRALCFCFGLVLSQASANAADQTLTPQQAEFFELSIRPLLAEKCAKCHTGKADARSELRMDSRQALLHGGEFGPAIAPGNAEESLLVQAVRRTNKELQMPPDFEDRLTAAEVEALSQWVAAGAFWPGSDEDAPSLAHLKDKRESIETDHWSFQPRKVMEPPTAADHRWNGNGIDQFLESARQKANLPAVETANRQTLIRRVTFDLTGLPPQPKEVREFLEDPASDELAYAKLVDRLLASPQYGERWGRHWLDVARYADTQGEVGDIPVPTAYLYRNWVIDALNRDLPFDQFIQAQIAGDVLAQHAANEEEARGLIVATGFVSLSRRFGNSKSNDMHLTIEDTLDTLGRGVMGMTLRCARCHDHKFDPIPHEDYYGLYGIFESTTYPWMGASNEKSPSDLAPAMVKEGAREELEDYWALISRYEYQLNNHFRPWLKPTLQEYKEVCAQMDELREDGADLTSLENKRQKLLKERGGKFRELMEHGLDWIKKEKTRLAEDPPLEMVFAVGEGKPRDTKLHRRGNPENLGDVVPRHFLQVIDGPEPPEIASGSGRLELAEWLTQPDHPLTSRVLVNRIWMHHFGRGLVNTPDNFGVQGATPSHPELLDWLAETFIQDGWSLKALHWRIVTSRSYQLSSEVTASNLDRDPENIYVWHYPRRRLEAEALRDATLAVSGQLDLTPGEAHPFPGWHVKKYSLNSPFQQEYETNQRSVYLMTQRLFKHSYIGLFDGPDTNSSMSQRGASSVPSQALFLMNSEFEQAQATSFAKRLLSEPASTEKRIDHAYQLAYGRSPSASEAQEIGVYLEAYTASSSEEEAWTSVARAILTSNEFFFID